MKYIIGIDTGLSGGIAVFHPNGPIEVFEMPLLGKQLDERALYEIIARYPLSNMHVVTEDVGQIFKTSKKTALSMGYQKGVLTGILIGNNIPFTKISPKAWQKVMFAGAPLLKNTKGANDTKAMSVAMCKRLFPEVNIKTGVRVFKDHDGMADAIMLAEFARRTNLI
jgi:hypothetical protein